jgi:hypothetical protein
LNTRIEKISEIPQGFDECDFQANLHHNLYSNSVPIPRGVELETDFRLLPGFPTVERKFMADFSA